MYCTKCGEELKTGAKFCHVCGAPVSDTDSKANKKASPAKQPQKQSWLHSFGAFLLIPVFAVIVILLFWENKDPGPISQSSSANTAPNGAPDMAGMQKIHETLDRLKSSLESNPKDLVALDSLAVMYSIAGSHDKARSFYERHLEIEPENKDIKIALALTYHNLQNDTKATEILQGVLKEEPTYAFALYYLAEIEDAQHNHEQAAKYWQSVIDNHPGTQIADVAQERLQGQHVDE